MEQIDLLYRIARNSLNELEKDTVFKRTESLIRSLGSSGKADCKFRECIIDTEWIVIIEELLPYVEKSIEENRHFIKKDGDVVRIDQVRKVSADSVEHLSRHSNYLSKKVQEGAALMPEKLYVTESTDNYQLYENRFLYTLLVFLKDFIQTRYNEIISECSAAFYEISFDGTAAGNETYSLKVCMNEKDEGIRFDTANLSCGREIERIDALTESVTGLLETTLMKSCAPLATLTLPVTATNIIKKDPNFQLSYRLWDFVLNYNKKGFEIKESHRIVSPISKDSCDVISAVIAFMSMAAKAEGMSLYEKIRGESVKYSLETKTGIPEIDSLKEQLLAEKEKNEELTHTLDAMTFMNETSFGYEERIKSLENELSAVRTELERQNAELLRQISEKQSEITALRIQNGSMNAESYTDEDEFRILTQEKEAFDSYYADKFKTVKKNLRKKYIWDKFKEK